MHLYEFNVYEFIRLKLKLFYVMHLMNSMLMNSFQLKLKLFYVMHLMNSMLMNSFQLKLKLFTSNARLYDSLDPRLSRFPTASISSRWKFS